ERRVKSLAGVLRVLPMVAGQVGRRVPVVADAGIVLAQRQELRGDALAEHVPVGTRLTRRDRGGVVPGVEEILLRRVERAQAGVRGRGDGGVDIGTGRWRRQPVT